MSNDSKAQRAQKAQKAEGVFFSRSPSSALFPFFWGKLYFPASAAGPRFPGHAPGVPSRPSRRRLRRVARERPRSARAAAHGGDPAPLREDPGLQAAGPIEVASRRIGARSWKDVAVVGVVQRGKSPCWPGGVNSP